jgi:hypothetical protein
MIFSSATWPQWSAQYYILALMKTNRVDAASREFLEILNRHASPTIKEHLLRDLAAHG